MTNALKSRREVQVVAKGTQDPWQAEIKTRGRQTVALTNKEAGTTVYIRLRDVDAACKLLQTAKEEALREPLVPGQQLYEALQARRTSLSGGSAGAAWASLTAEAKAFYEDLARRKWTTE